MFDFLKSAKGLQQLVWDPSTVRIPVPEKTRFTSRFDFGETAIIDKTQSGLVTGFHFSFNGEEGSYASPRVEVCWATADHAGTGCNHHREWIEEWRLSKP